MYVGRILILSFFHTTGINLVSVQLRMLGCLWEYLENVAILFFGIHSTWQVTQAFGKLLNLSKSIQSKMIQRIQ